MTPLSPLRVLDSVPAELLTIEPTQVGQVLPGPTLIHLAGRRPQPLFVSVFLHGNETTGFLALQNVLRRYTDRQLPRALSLFFGNIEAAGQQRRRLDHQPDYNRIWPGTELPACKETALAQHVVEDMAQRRLFASIDIHNNTGLNPHYSCVTNLKAQTLQLAALFGRLCIYSVRPKGIQTGAFAPYCPSITLECGKPGLSFGSEHAAEFVDACLHIAEIPDHPVPRHDLELYRSVGQILIKPEIDFGMGREAAELNLRHNLDHLNFKALSAACCWGEFTGSELPLIVLNAEGEDVADHFFQIEGGRLLLRREAMPSMLTVDERVIRQDCLGYLMEPLSVY